MVIWDTNILALYFGGRLAGDDKLRMDGLVLELKRKRESIGIPAQVWAEFLEGATPEERDKSFMLFKAGAFKLLPYDMRAAIETAEVSNRGKAVRKGAKEKTRDRQAVKVDWQIIAVAIVNNSRLLLSNDVDMVSESIRGGLHAIKISDLPIPDGLRQKPLEFSEAQ